MYFLTQVVNKRSTVLIDTWWNVNSEIKSMSSLIRVGFNRYMVECELIRKRMTAQIFLCFNRYMVECEYFLLFQNSCLQRRFNRYMVECELT